MDMIEMIRKSVTNAIIVELHLNLFLGLLPWLHHVTHINRRNKNAAATIPYMPTVFNRVIKK